MTPYLCDMCEQPVNPDQPGTWKLIEGWAQARKGGGVHGISLPSPPRKYRCKLCMDYHKLRGGADQPTLF